MWRKFLQEEQGPFLVPPYFKTAQVQSKGGQVFEVQLSKALREWSWVTAEGDVLKPALCGEVADELERYPSLLCAFIQRRNSKWIVASKAGPLVLRLPPDSTDIPLPLTRIRSSLLGTVLVFYSFDYRDAEPWTVDRALMELKRDPLPDKAPRYLCEEQKVAFTLLLEQERAERIPPTERKVKDILQREGAGLISLREMGGGYAISFNYEGRRRDVQINENLVLLDAGMCLSGRQRDFSLDSFLSILHGSRELDHYPYHDHNDGW